MGGTRNLEIRRPVPAGATPVEQLSTLELQQELARRIERLESERAKLLERVDEIDMQLASVGAGRRRRREDADAPPRRTLPRNERPLIDVLYDIVEEHTDLTTREIAQAARDAGYKSTSPKFQNIVGTALKKDDRFERVDNTWRLVH